KPYRKNALTDHPWKGTVDDDGGNGSASRRPGGQSRWSQGKDLSWEPLRLELVAEVAYEHLQNGRFRHMAQFRRWRFDKKPEDCTYESLEVIPPKELKAIFPQSR
ncbi:MAG TPA: ATP-dependent DNA ligase, partial [Acidobacteriaceae bacterium]|nr:ATP-dependent DNA ligase [Acidobacteriaceae bacterium]